MTEEGVRLYSKQQRLPVDEVALEHRQRHADLDRWGRWNRERREQGACASIESKFDDDGGRETRKAVVVLPPDPLLSAIEAVVVAMLVDKTIIARAGKMVILSSSRRVDTRVARVEEYGETIVEYYSKQWEPKTICWAHALRYEDFRGWMFDCRAMVIKRLETHGKQPS